LRKTDTEWSVVDEQESTWTESDWGRTQCELFRVENPVTEWMMLVFGVAEIGVAFAAVWYGKRWFGQRVKST
jgi:hypothetical protein